MIRSFHRAIVPLLLALASTWSAPAGAQPPIVENPATPAEGRVTVTPTETWRLGGDSDDDAEFFGVVRNAVIDPAGNTYLLDSQLHEVKVFDAQGEFVTSFGREGEGPGELRNPRDLVLLPDGRIGVIHGRPVRITAFAPSGGMGEDVTIGEGESFGFTMRAESAGDVIVAQRSITTIGDGTQTSDQMLVAIDPATGAHRTVYLRDTQTQDQPAVGRGRMMVMFNAAFLSDWAAGPDGRVYVVRGGDAYEIEVYAPDGTHERTIRRAYERVAKPEEVVENERAQRRRLAERMGGNAFGDDDVELFYPNVLSMQVRPNGELWVLPSSGRASDDPEVLGVFDVFDGEGRFVRQVELRVPFERGEDEFSFEGDDLVVFESSVDAQRAMNGANGLFMVRAGDEEDDDEEPEPLSIVRYAMPEVP